MAGGIISLLVALDMLSNRRQQRKEQGSDIASQDDLSAGYPAADWPGGHHSVMVVSSGAGGYLKLSLLGLVALTSVMAATALILIATSLAESYVDKRVTSVFFRINAIILAGLSLQYMIDGTALSVITATGYIYCLAICCRQNLCPVFGCVDTPMRLDILINGVLFPTIPLMMINFGNRYSLLAGLIRSLHDTVINAQTPSDDNSRFFQQIASLRQRLRLLAVIQTFSAGTLILNLSAMISLYLNISDAGSWLFFCAIILIILSMILFTLEIQITNSALDANLSDLEKHQEWKDCDERKNSDISLHQKHLTTKRRHNPSFVIQPW